MDPRDDNDDDDLGPDDQADADAGPIIRELRRGDDPAAGADRSDRRRRGTIAPVKSPSSAPGSIELERRLDAIHARHRRALEDLDRDRRRLRQRHWPGIELPVSSLTPRVTSSSRS